MNGTVHEPQFKTALYAAAGGLVGGLSGALLACWLIQCMGQAAS